MEELKQIVEKKIKIYVVLFNTAKDMNQEDNIKYYADSIDKLNAILKII